MHSMMVLWHPVSVLALIFSMLGPGSALLRVRSLLVEGQPLGVDRAGCAG
jgi:hypothetical protein